MAKNTSLSSVLKELKRKGCYPCVSYRGDGIWRAHINGAGNWWAEDKTPQLAMTKAKKEWEENGCIMDGYAAQRICSTSA